MAIGLLVEGTWLDLREGEENRFFLNKTLHDLRDMFGRDSDRSRGIVLPRTANNINALVKYAPTLGDTYKALICQVYMSGVPVLEDANLVITGEDKNHYEAQIVGGAATFYTLLSGDSIRNLDFEADNFEWTLAEYVARVNNASGVVTAWAQWFTNDSYQQYLDDNPDPNEELEAVNIDRAGFCYYIKDILAKIFENTQLEINLDGIQETPYNEIVIVCPMPEIFESFDSVINERGEVSFLDIYPVPEGSNKIPYDEVISNTGIWDIINFWFTVPVIMEVEIYATLRTRFNSVPTSVYGQLVLEDAGGVVTILQEQQIFSGASALFRETLIAAPGEKYYMRTRMGTLQGNPMLIEPLVIFRMSSTAGLDREIEIYKWLPDISQRELVKNVFNLFHIVVSDISGKIVLSLFEKITQEPQINLEDRIAQDRQIKYSPRLSGYGQVNRFKYADEPLVDTTAFNAVININNNTLEDVATKIELYFAGMDESFFPIPGQTVPMFEVDYHKEDNNLMNMTDGAPYDSYNTNDSNDLKERDILFMPDGGGIKRFTIWKVLDNRKGLLTSSGEAVANAQDWTFAHYTLNTHRLQLCQVLPDAVNTRVYFQDHERAETLSSLYTDVINFDTLLEDYYPEYRRMIELFQVVNVWVDIPNTVFLELNSLRPIYILGNNYYLNETEQYKENGLVRLELIKYN